MKLSDLRNQRNLLAKYDSLKSTLSGFNSLKEGLGYRHNISFTLPGSILSLDRDSIDIIIAALEAEIEKLNETEI